MALRYSSKAAVIALAGTTFNHGLQAVPDGALAICRTGGAGAGIYLVSTPTSTSAIFAMSGAAGSADVYVWVDHTIIK